MPCAHRQLATHVSESAKACTYQCNVTTVTIIGAPGQELRQQPAVEAQQKGLGRHQ